MAAVDEMSIRDLFNRPVESVDILISRLTLWDTKAGGYRLQREQPLFPAVRHPLHQREFGPFQPYKLLLVIIWMAAFPSRSCCVLQAGQDYARTASFSSSSTLPHAEQVRLEGKKRSMIATYTPYHCPL